MLKKGQIAVFVIIAIVIVGAAIAFFVIRNNGGFGAVPSEFESVFSTYASCIQRETEDALAIAGSQGGRITFENYRPGSDYAPFSSHLFYLGAAIPYWYGVTGNGLVTESIPTKSEIERDIGVYLNDHLTGCDLSGFSAQGLVVDVGTPRASVQIADSKVSVGVSAPLTVSRGDDRATKTTHTTSVDSRFGSLYTQARALYESERESSFLENYAVDALRSYAPVDGVGVQCSPLIWKTPEVVANLTQGLALTYDSVKFKGTDYTLRDADDSYFVVNHQMSVPTRVIYSSSWPQKVEVTPADNVAMVANPIGNQEGLGLLGFCYVPYHFVYDVSFPVVMQLYDGNELFQFPVVVIIDNNVARSAASSGIAEPSAGVDICSFKEGRARINVVDSNLNPVQARVSYQCFNQVCDLGETTLQGSEAVLDAAIPVCYNGQLLASAEGYALAKKPYSSNRERNADIVLERLYPVNVNLMLDGRAFSGTSIIHFVSDEASVSAVLPDSSSVMLREGMYNISVYAYGNSSVVLPASTKTECVTVPRGGIAGFFGSTQQRCFEVTSPATKIDYALRGGGVSETYILPSELERGSLTLYAQSLPLPTSIEQLQTNFEVFSEYGVEVSFV